MISTKGVHAFDPNHRVVIGMVDSEGEFVHTASPERIDRICVPIRFRGYLIESLVRGGWVHIRMVGRHKQNSREERVRIDDLALNDVDQASGSHVRMLILLRQMSLDLMQEDILFDKLEGKE